jgi:hypothetical protein
MNIWYTVPVYVFLCGRVLSASCRGWRRCWGESRGQPQSTGGYSTRGDHQPLTYRNSQRQKELQSQQGSLIITFLPEPWGSLIDCTGFIWRTTLNTVPVSCWVSICTVQYITLRIGMGTYRTGSERNILAVKEYLPVPTIWYLNYLSSFQHLGPRKKLALISCTVGYDPEPGPFENSE